MSTVHGIPKRNLRPASELAAERPHGDRLRYSGGCRCDECRKANTAYEKARRAARKNGEWNGIVSAAPARRHMLKLAKQHVGLRAFAEATDVSRSILQRVRNGNRKGLRAMTAKKILAVTKEVALDGALVPADETKRLIAELLEEGYTESRLCQELGYKGEHLQFSCDRVTVHNAGRVRRLYERLTT